MLVSWAFQFKSPSLSIHPEFSKHRRQVSLASFPSNLAQHEEYEFIQGSGDALLDGRFTSNAAPPIELYHPCFAHYKQYTQDVLTDVPEDLVRSVAVLMRELAQVRIDDEREYECRGKLAAILGVALKRNNVLLSGCSSFDVETKVGSTTAAPVIVEVQDELGQGESDPSVRVSFAYAKYYCSEEVSTTVLAKLDSQLDTINFSVPSFSRHPSALRFWLLSPDLGSSSSALSLPHTPSSSAYPRSNGLLPVTS